jgi:methyltransferase (TIGR00027 family)
VSARPAAGLTVPDTALGTAFQRAEESSRRRALFRDPFAADLAGPSGRGIARTMGGSWAITVRTRVFDDLLLSAIRTHGVEAVIDLGAGLDARPYRLELPPNLLWVELDSQPTIDYKERVLAAHRPRCRLERHSGDIADRAVRERLFDLTASRPALILTEGVLHYLQEEVVRGLAGGARSRPNLGWWLLDVGSPLSVEWGRRSTTAVDLWRFTPEAGVDFFRPLGWEPEEVRSAWLEARRLHRQSLVMRISWALAPRGRDGFLRLSTYALLRRSEPAG